MDPEERRLRRELSATNSHGVHPQKFAGTNLAGRPVAHNQHLAGGQPGLLVYLAEGFFFGQSHCAVGIKGFFYRRFAVQPQGLNFFVLGFGLAEAHDEISHAARS